MAKNDRGIALHEALAIREAGRRRKSGGERQGGSAMGAIFGIFPLILIPVLIYNIIAFGGSALKNAQSVRLQMGDTALQIPMASSETLKNASGIPSIEHVQWLMTWGRRAGAAGAGIAVRRIAEID
ncbi:MAG: hypothetical protein WDN76_11050 [Alphaproteobacteria bacterium]